MRTLVTGQITRQRVDPEKEETEGVTQAKVDVGSIDETDPQNDEI